MTDKSPELKYVTAFIKRSNLQNFLNKPHETLTLEDFNDLPIEHVVFTSNPPTHISYLARLNELNNDPKFDLVGEDLVAVPAPDIFLNNLDNILQ